VLLTSTEFTRFVRSTLLGQHYAACDSVPRGCGAMAEEETTPPAQFSTEVAKD
jgi:hypothetical protein